MNLLDDVDYFVDAGLPVDELNSILVPLYGERDTHRGTFYHVTPGCVRLGVTNTQPTQHVAVSRIDKQDLCGECGSSLLEHNHMLDLWQTKAGLLLNCVTWLKAAHDGEFDSLDGLIELCRGARSLVHAHAQLTVYGFDKLAAIALQAEGQTRDAAYAVRDKIPAIWPEKATDAGPHNLRAILIAGWQGPLAGEMAWVALDSALSGKVAVVPLDAGFLEGWPMYARDSKLRYRGDIMELGEFPAENAENAIAAFVALWDQGGSVPLADPESAWHCALASTNS